MKSYLLWSLLALNGCLLAIFVYRMTPMNAANAQVGARAGDYLMVPGEVIGGTNAYVYVLDQTNHRLAAMAYDDSMKALMRIAPRDIDRDFDAMNNGGNGVRRGR